jgi:hypothetical protein
VLADIVQPKLLAPIRKCEFTLMIGQAERERERIQKQLINDSAVCTP